VVTYVETGMWDEILALSPLRTTSALSREIERELRELLLWADLGDDRVFEPVYYVPMVMRLSGWGVETCTTTPDHRFGARRFDPVIVAESDIDKIRAPHVEVDREATRRKRESVTEVVGDLLTVTPRGYFVPWFAPLDLFVEWRGLENLFLDMVDRPRWLHEVLERLTQGYLSLLGQYEAQGGLSLNVRSHFVGSGGCGFVDELPQRGFDGAHVRPADLWGQAAAQILSEVSPAMHEEFAFPYDCRWLERFGLGCYGCCEPLQHKLDLIKRLPRLRRVSISPRADVAAAAAQLGNRYILSWKPNPAVFAVERWDLEAIRRYVRDALERARGCVVEIVMKDTHTCRREPRRIGDWTRIAVEEAARAGDRA
jgi:hypothetical protein